MVDICQQPNPLHRFFADKITKLHASIPASTAPSAAQVPPSVPLPLTSFRTVTNDEICQLIQSAPDKQCELDPIPTSLLKKCIHLLAPAITNIVNLSLDTGNFPHAFKQSIITPLIKKPSLDPENLSNYRPISQHNWKDD